MNNIIFVENKEIQMKINPQEELELPKWIRILKKAYQDYIKKQGETDGKKN